jgi:hypothetical protein
MACGHGKLWWKGCGSPRHKERVPRGQGQGPGRTEGVSPPEADRQSGILQLLMLSHGTNTGQHLKQIDGLAHSALSLESHRVVTRC